MLTIYNTLTRQLETITTQADGKTINMYVCGVTTYDDCHIGHARTFTAFDVIVRYLRHSGYHVNYVRNITDIDDKIINRALKDDVSFETITSRYIERMHEDFDALGMLRPDQEPQATQYIPQIIDFISTLIEQGHAYATSAGDVYYSVQSFEQYGMLSGQDLDALEQGERVGAVELKQHKHDFALWKAAKPSEPYWESPWGNGRPGWHIECSVMSKNCLGDEFDIHGGGSDLIFPHHENEIAQSDACCGHQVVKQWLHSGMVRINDEKMSKSLGNFFTIRDVLKHYRPEVVRYFLLSGHYRSPLNYSERELEQSEAALTRLYTALRKIDFEEGMLLSEWQDAFNSAMDDDFNTPKALAVIFDLARKINKLKSESNNDSSINNHAFTLQYLMSVLGLGQHAIDAYFKDSTDLDEAFIDELVASRDQARANKDWAESDRLRDQLLEQGVVLEDTPNGTIWRKK